MAEPSPHDSSCPRYSARTLPPYRFVPGQRPHPRRDPKRPPDLGPLLFSLEQWFRSDDYLYGIDLYNHAYWWECHEIFEALWNAAGHQTEPGNFFQALIQLAAANLKGFFGNDRAAETLMRRGLARLQQVPAPSYMGINVPQLAEDLRGRIARSHWQAPSIRLTIPDRETRAVQSDC